MVRSYLALNLSWLLGPSLETPITSAPVASNCAFISEKALASLVQPEVSSLG